MPADSAAVRMAILDALSRIPPSSDDAVVLSTDTEIAAGDGTLQLGRSGPGELVALVPASPETVGMSARAGLSLTVQQLRPAPGDAPRSFLVLTCHRPHLEDTFLDLVALTAELFVEQPGNAADTMQRQFVRWRELFAEAPRDRLTTGQAAGVLAELIALGQICHVEGPAAIDTWQGPLGARHDFYSSPDSLEVKAVVGAAIERVTIHGVEQLLAPPDGSLHLAVYRLEPDTGDRSIAGEFAALVDAGIDPLELREKLQAVGVEVGSSVATREWRLAEERLYVVTDDFPRVVPSSFEGGAAPDGVSDLRYATSLSGVPPIADRHVARSWRSGPEEAV